MIRAAFLFFAVALQQKLLLQASSQRQLSIQLSFRSVEKFRIPSFKSQAKSQFATNQERDAHAPPLFKMIDEKISVSSRASAAKAARPAALFFVKPTSTSRKNKRLSLASFRQIFARIRKSFLLNA